MSSVFVVTDEGADQVVERTSIGQFAASNRITNPAASTSSGPFGWHKRPPDGLRWGCLQTSRADH
jgi:hypothetical protein